MLVEGRFECFVEEAEVERRWEGMYYVVLAARRDGKVSFLYGMLSV